MKKLIFFTSVTGHNLEFIHHLYEGFVQSSLVAVFVLPERFLEQRRLLQWTECERISFDLMTMDEMGAIYPSARKKAQLLRDHIQKNQVHDVFVADIKGLMPWLPFYTTKQDKICGLLWEVYFYRWHSRARWKNLIEASFHWLICHCKSVDKVLVGNDSSAAAYFNRFFHTHKYVASADPFNRIEVPFADLRQQYGIDDSRKIMYHFGSMGGRKGTNYILQSILDMPQEEREKYCFVFAGIIQNKPQFYDYVNRINDDKLVKVFDKFCEFEFIQQWCMNCDAILIPYTTTHQSSGILGYAAQYKKPVIGPSSGLVGKLIRFYHLGIGLPAFTSNLMLDAYQNVQSWEYEENDYLVKNSADNFTNLVIYGK